MKTHCLTSPDSNTFLLLLPMTEPLSWETLLAYLEPHLYIFQTQEYCSAWQQSYLTTQALLQTESFLAQHRCYLWKSDFANQTRLCSCTAGNTTNIQNTPLSSPALLQKCPYCSKNMNLGSIHAKERPRRSTD